MEKLKAILEKSNPWTGKESVTLESAIKLLNGLIKIDQKAVSEMMMHRTACNESLGKHPTVQVRLRDNTYSFGALGLLNGLFGVSEKKWGAITAILDEKTNLIRSFTLSKK